MATRAPRGPADPDRRDRIVEATIRVVSQVGVDGVTHRRVAAEAGVPVGSTTYYFASLDELIMAALARTVDDYRDYLQTWSGDRETPTAPRLLAMITDLIMESLTTRRDETTVEYVLYLAAITRPGLRPQAHACTEMMIETLAPHVGRARATQLAATIDGLMIRGLISPVPLTRRTIRAALSEALPTS